VHELVLNKVNVSSFVYPPLDVHVSCHNLCHMASTLSVVSCRICQAHSLVRHTLTHIAVRIDYDRLYASGCHLLSTGVSIVETHYVKRDISELHTVRPDFCFYPSFEIGVGTLYNKILFLLKFTVRTQLVYVVLILFVRVTTCFCPN
jgi:hypothetical protein